MKCPCEECMCIPICRSRHITISTEVCSLLDQYMEAGCTKYKQGSIKIIDGIPLKEVNRIFNWGSYDYTG